MSTAPPAVLAPVSYDLTGAAAATGLSERTIRDAITRGDLTAHYSGRKPLVLRDELTEWVAAMPTERQAP